MTLHVKRLYEDPSRRDGRRILVDRLWPRGLRKEKAAIDEWRKDLAPSDELRRWFGHDPKRWSEFRRRYWEELEDHEDELRELGRLAREEEVTLVFAARDPERNNAMVLKELIEELSG